MKLDSKKCHAGCEKRNSIRSCTFIDFNTPLLQTFCYLKDKFKGKKQQKIPQTHCGVSPVN
jgi:hypothetical protein